MFSCQMEIILIKIENVYIRMNFEEIIFKLNLFNVDQYTKNKCNIFALYLEILTTRPIETFI